MTRIHDDVLDRYDAFLAKKTKKVECVDKPGYTYPHLRWMIQQIRSGVVDGEKSHRWLGFIQGVLIREDHFKVNEERDFTRPYFKELKMGQHWEMEDVNTIYFWGGIFSNWSKHGFTAQLVKDGPFIDFNCAEQYMMATKALLFDDAGAMWNIMNTDNPKNQKAHGRAIVGYSDAKWDPVARDRSYIGIYEKFRQNDTIRELLVSTGNKLLVEASAFDTKWGIGFDYLAAPTNKADWGRNWLGQILMKVRDDIRSGTHSCFETIDWSKYEKWNATNG